MYRFVSFAADIQCGFRYLQVTWLERRIAATEAAIERIVPGINGEDLIPGDSMRRAELNARLISLEERHAVASEKLKAIGKVVLPEQGSPS